MLRNQTKTKVLITLILAMTVLVYACRKDLLSSTDPTDPAYRMDVDLARKIYSDLKKEKGALVKPIKTSGGALMSSNKGGVPSNNNNRRYALFQKAYESETEKSTLVEIPIVYNQRYSLTVINPKTVAKTSVTDRQLIFKYSFDRFLVYKDKSTGKISTRMLTYIPSIDYLKKHHNKITHNQINKLDADFSGFIEFKEWDGTGLYLLQYENGKKIRYFSLKKAVSQKASTTLAKTENVDTMSTIGCEPVLIEIWGEACITVGPEEDDQEPKCEPYLVDSYYVIPVCDDEPDPCIDYGICDTGDPCIDYGDCDYGDDPDPDPTDPPEIEQDSLIKNFCDDMTQAQKTIIENAVNELKTYDCATEYMYNHFDNKNTSFGFCIGSGIGSGSYSPSNGGFNFTSDAAAGNMYIMEHEFIHAYQDDVYPNGTEQYGLGPNGPLDGFVNIEFEQALMNDMINYGNTTAFDFSGATQAQKDAYLLWINQTTSNGTTYPKLNPSGTTTEIAAYNTFMSSYNSFLASYNALSGNPNHSTALNLSPQALIKLFNNINRNC
ncbi:hypothetical protein GM921_00420 [Pedobacter sp. LMG 31464]|uniref:Uncharacterized protein n=1 Tax=Pedobacter planticolens TaxID=2679964 RepID=A0A923DW76_9SPHI|nr:hypothetical protein [Pedobacter planticolens]MBB2143933.1 hypothetical protein [Pedobacter planticolens]